MSVLEWQEVARDELANIYVVATPDEREQIVVEVERIERDLKDDPLEVGKDGWAASAWRSVASSCFGSRSCGAGAWSGC